MSTHCLIGRKVDKNKVEYIYCHHDGYLEGVGLTLKHHYVSTDKIDSLMKLGNLSGLGPIPESSPDQWDNKRIDFNICSAYKDRGEKGTESSFMPLEDYLNEPTDMIRYIYLWDGKEWRYSDLAGGPLRKI